MKKQSNHSIKKAAVLVLTAATLSLGAMQAHAEDGGAGTPPAKQGTWIGNFFHAGMEAPERKDGSMNVRPAVVGTVTAISGTTLTVNSLNSKDGTATVYTVDAANAKVAKDHAASAIANIAVGDTVIVVGAISGTTVTATNINADAMLPRPEMAKRMIEDGKGPIMGEVTAVSDTTLSVSVKERGETTNTAPSSTTYSVDAASAKIENATGATTLSSIAVGDKIMIVGTVTGTNIVATTIRDGAMAKGMHESMMGSENDGSRPAATVSAPSVDQSATTQQPAGTPAPHTKFFGRIGSFFGRIFGF